MAYSQVTGMSSTRFPLKGLGCGCSTPMSGLGQATMDPETRWRYTSYALGALLVAQFFWWDSKAPQVLRGGGYIRRNRRRRRR